MIKKKEKSYAFKNERGNFLFWESRYTIRTHREAINLNDVNSFDLKKSTILNHFSLYRGGIFLLP